MIKKIIALLLFPSAVFAFSPVRQVQISTNTIPQQQGSFNVQAGTAATILGGTITSTAALNVNGTATETHNSSPTFNGAATFNGALTASSGTVLGGSGFSVKISSNAIMPNATFYSGGPILMGASGVSVQISSNTILPGATFYQNGSPSIGSASLPLTLSSATANGNNLINRCGFSLGAVVQISSITATNSQTVTNTSFTNASNWNTSITLKCISDVVRITWSGTVNPGATTQTYFLTIMRGASSISSGTAGLSSVFETANTQFPTTISLYDSPATSSSVTYGLAAKSSASGINICDGGNNTQCTMTLEEIAQ